MVIVLVDRIGGFATGGGGIGINASADAYIGIIRGPLSTVADNTGDIKLALGPVSVTLIFNDCFDFQGATVVFGPGLPGGLSWTADHTEMRTLRNGLNSLGGSPKNLPRSELPSGTIW